ERDAVERNQRNGAYEEHRTARASTDRCVDEVEPHLLFFLHDEGSAEQHDPYPEDRAELVGPAGRPVQHVAEDDLQQKGEEHRSQHRHQDVFGAPVQPGAKRRKTCLHLSLPPGPDGWPPAPMPAALAPQSALILSTMPSGHSLARSEARYFPWTLSRKAATSGS